MKLTNRLLLFCAVSALGFGASAVVAEPIGKVELAPGARISRLDPALETVVAPNAKIERVATGLQFVEGPMWRKGALWFSDLHANKMYMVTPDGKLTVLLDHAGGLDSFAPGANKGSNAMVTDKDGTVLMNQHGARRIVRLDDQMHITPFLEKYEGKRLNSPNDLVFAPDGALWITDPPYTFFDPTHPEMDLDKNPAKELRFNAVWRYKDGTLTPAITDLPRPNGIGFSPDGKTLYISNTEPQALILKYDVGADGKLSNRKIVADLSKTKGIGVPDGLKVDSQGDLWATGQGGIRIFSADGKVLGQIILPEVASNLAWGGADRKTVYIMASTNVYRIPLKIAGEKPLYEKP
jgi:gluconolactonase